MAHRTVLSCDSRPPCHPSKRHSRLESETGFSCIFPHIPQGAACLREMTPSIQHLTPPVADGCHKRKRAMLDCAAGPTGSHRQKVARMAKEMSPSAAWFREAKDESSEAAGVPTHPLRVKPLGNALDAAENIKDMAGSFSRLPDELLVQILEYLEGVDLLRCGSSCRALYAYCNLDELWKALMIVYVQILNLDWSCSAESSNLHQISHCHQIHMAWLVACYISANTRRACTCGLLTSLF